MSRWWRAYDEAVDDPKLQQLPPPLFKAWFNVCCITSQNGGALPPIEAIAFKLRMKVDKARQVLALLAAAGLVDDDGNGNAAPHNWKARQFQSDVSTERVKRFRKRRGNVSSDVSETPPETDTEAETEQKGSEARASAADAAPVYTDSRHELWGEGIPILKSLGVSERSARSNIGRWLKAEHDDAQAVLGAIQRARDNRVIDPVPWVTQALRTKNGNGTHQAKSERAGGFEDPILAGMGRIAARLAGNHAAGGPNDEKIPGSSNVAGERNAEPTGTRRS